jgi:hypothetical protein
MANFQSEGTWQGASALPREIFRVCGPCDMQMVHEVFFCGMLTQVADECLLEEGLLHVCLVEPQRELF